MWKSLFFSQSFSVGEAVFTLCIILISLHYWLCGDERLSNHCFYFLVFACVHWVRARMLITRPHQEVTIVLAKSETRLTSTGAGIVSALWCVHSCMLMADLELRRFRYLPGKAYLFLYFAFVLLICDYLLICFCRTVETFQSEALCASKPRKFS